MSSIPRILREHFTEYAELLPVYRALRNDDACTEDDLRSWEDRLSAHLDALLVDPQATAGLVAEAFDHGEPGLIAAATEIALRIDPAMGTARAMTFLETCEAPEQAIEVITSLREGNADLSRCSEAIGSVHEWVAIAVLEVLLERDGLQAPPGALDRLFRSQSPEIRQAAWRIVGDLSLPKSPGTLSTAGP